MTTRLELLSGLLDKLEEQVRRLELITLEKDLSQLESEIDYTKLSVDELKELFIKEMLTTYSALIDSKCREMELRIRSPYMTKDDFKQEVFEYLLRWCFPRILDFTTRRKLWVPYVKRSLYNCFVNQLKKNLTASRSGTVVELDDYLLDTIVDPSLDVESEYEYNELIRRVVNRLGPRDARILLDILDPPKKLLRFIKKFQRENGPAPRKALARYYGMTNFGIASTFSRFREAISECTSV